MRRAPSAYAGNLVRPRPVELVEADLLDELARRRARARAAARDLQPRVALLRPAVLGRPRAHGRVRGRRRRPRCSRRSARSTRACASTRHRPARSSASPRDPADRGHAALARHAVRRREGVRRTSSPRSYRRRYGLFTCGGILYNHESPRRPLEFLPRKVAHAAAAISLGLQDDAAARRPRRPSRLGLRTGLRAGDVAHAPAGRARRLHRRDRRGHSVRELVALAFSRVGLDWEQHVDIDASLQRGSAELHDLVGDAARLATSSAGRRR